MPVTLTLARSPWVAPAFLLAFLVASTALILFSDPLTRAYGQLIGASGVPNAAVAELPMRVRFLFWAVLALFPLFQPGPLAERLRLAAAAWLTYVGASAALDRATVSASLAAHGAAVLAADAVAAGGLGFVVLSCLLLGPTRMPPDRRVVTVRRRRGYGARELALALAVSLAATWLALGPGHGVVAQARSLGVIGGVGPGVLVFFPALTLAAVALGARRLRKDRRGRAVSVPPASVAVLVPAYNEERIIEACIRSIDRAAREYRGSTRIYVVDNASLDRTAELARTALAACRHATGQLLECSERGKSRALNRGLASIEEPVVIRVDADTRLSEGAIAGCVWHFADGRVGAVGGLPLPDSTSHFIGRMRAIEVYSVHGFTRIGWGATDVMLGVPGMFAGYRRSCLRELGGFAEGMNGEDTDVALGIARLGYRLVADPGLVVWTEVPSSLAQLREQRLRWFRAGLHVFARNRSAILMRQGVRSVWGLPWSVLQTVRRAMLLPLLLYALLAWALDPDLLRLLDGAALLAVLAGPPLFLPALALVCNRRFGLLAQLPGYTVFRLLRAYFTLDSMLTLRLRPDSENGLRRRLPARARGRSTTQGEPRGLGVAPHAATSATEVMGAVPDGRPRRPRARPGLEPDGRCALRRPGSEHRPGRPSERRGKPRSVRRR